LKLFDREVVDRFVDVASVVLISVAAVLTALCGYQSGRWSGEQARYYNVTNANRIDSSEASAKANMLTEIDIALFLQYIDAMDRGDSRKARFIERRFRPEMRPAMKAWLASEPEANPKAPTSPFVMPQYSLATRVEAERFDREAGASFEKARVANEHADNFLLLTVIFAGVSFLGGVSTKMAFPRHAILIALGTIGLVYGAIRLVELPFI